MNAAPPSPSAGLQHHAWSQRIVPPVELVKPGVWSIPVPMAGNPLRYVLVYAIEDGRDVVLFDAGWNTDDAWDALRSGLAAIGSDVGDVRHVVATHLHPDHLGLAGRVRGAARNCDVHLHEFDASLLDGRYAQTDWLVSAIERDLLSWGVPERLARTMAASALDQPDLVELCQPDRLLNDGDSVETSTRRFRTVWTPGHTPGHCCFFDASNGLLITGDHVLPRISPSVSCHPQHASNPLHQYRKSLDRVQALQASEVLPAHEYRFADIDARVRAIEDGLDARASEIVGVLEDRRSLTAWEVCGQISWARSLTTYEPVMQRAAVGEVAAHLVELERRGSAQRRVAAVTRWRRAAPAPPA